MVPGVVYVAVVVIVHVGTPTAAQGMGREASVIQSDVSLCAFPR